MNSLSRLTLVLMTATMVALSSSGCSSETKMEKGDPNAAIAPPAKKDLPKEKGGPPKGSSSGMNFNPGGDN